MLVKMSTSGNNFTTDYQTQELIAPVQDTLIAKQNYAEGQQFILGGALFTVTKSGGISVGDTINMNTDVEASDTITDQIKTINGKKIKLRYKVIATASGTATIASKLQTLYNTFSTLTLEERRLCYLEYDSAIFQLNRTDGLFSRFVAYYTSNAFGCYLIGADLPNKKYFYSQNSFTFADHSNDSISATFQLLKLEAYTDD